LITTATNPAAGLTFAVRAAVCDKGRMDTIEYLDRIRDARVYDVADKTPLELAKNLSKRLGNRFLSLSSRSSCAGPITRFRGSQTTKSAGALSAVRPEITHKELHWLRRDAALAP
jgi:hypothetical protein